MHIIDRIHNELSNYLINKYVLILAFYSLLTSLMTYPLIIKAFSHLPGGIDIYVFIWRFYYTGQFISQLSSLGQVGYTNYIFYPDGIQVIPFFSAYNQLLSLLMAPLFSFIFTCNILYLSSFILSAFGAYLLVYHITKDEAASLISGIVFSFAPYHFAHAFAGHLGAVTMQWIPFCALFVIKMFENKKIGDAFLASIFFILVAMSDLQYMVFIGMFIILYILYGIVTGSIKLDKRSTFLIVFFSIVSLIGVLPLTLEIITATLSSDNYIDAGSQAKYFSNDLFSFFIPANFNPVLGNIMTDIFHSISWTSALTQWEMTAYIGMCVLLLSIYAAVKDKNKLSEFWIISAIFFSLMSMGPILHVYGESRFFNMEIPMPYSLIAPIIPGLSNSRTPGRFDAIVVLSLAVLSGYGVSIINKKVDAYKTSQKTIIKLMIPAIITVIILFEYLAVPFTMIKPEVPSFYYRLANETGDYAIMEIPATYNYTSGVEAIYYQTVHHKHMVGGQEARISAKSRDFETNTPFVHQLTYLTNDSEDIFDQNITDIGSSILQYYNIRYIVVHRDYLSDSQLLTVSGYLNTSLGLESVKYDDGNLSVYHVNNTAMKLFMIPQDGWLGVENWSSIYTRWIKDNGTLLIYSPSTSEYDLSFASSGIYGNRTLQVFVNGHEVCENKISPFFTTIKVPIHLNEGKNTIWFISPEGSVRPHDIPGWDTNDTRDLSFAFQDIRVS